MDPIADEIASGPSEIRLVLRCDGGGYIGTLINNRWLELPCRASRCKRAGVQTVHRWDLLTSRKSTEYRPIPPAGDTPEGA